MADTITGALANLETATSGDRGLVIYLTEEKARLVRQLEQRSQEVNEVKSLLKKERYA
jgi:hypothetical protein